MKGPGSRPKRSPQSSSDELIAALAATQDFTAAWHWSPNTIKTKVFASSSALRAYLTLRVAPFVVSSDFLDLGIPTRAGPQARFGGVGPTRLSEARLRLTLIGRLPLPWAARGHLSSTSALAGAGYGLACALAPLDELRALTSTIQATWGHSFFHANPSILVALASPSWRWDPFGRAAIEPLLALHRAVRLGTVDLSSFAPCALHIAGGGRRQGGLRRPYSMAFATWGFAPRRSSRGIFLVLTLALSLLILS